MSSFHIRPRFQQIASDSPAEVQKKIQARLDAPDAPCIGKVIQGFVVLNIPEAEQHFWSPQLSLMLEEDEKGTFIRGLYGPNPTVWALFTFGYGAIAILATFAGVWGLSKMLLKQDSTILWSLPVFAGLALLLYLIAQFGQKLGVEQTFTLHHFYEEAVGERVHIS